MRIVFMGTPDFAVPTLDILVANGYDVVGVVTATDKPAGRGKQLSESAVKQYAVSKGLRVLQPEKLKDPAFLSKLQALKADLQVVVAFRMLPEVVWNMPPLGTINLHASLLPKYRGAAPINRAIMNGEKETGLTTFFLQHEIDTGNIIFQEEMPIGPDETAGQLHDRMMAMGAELVLKTIKAIEAGSYPQVPQAHVMDAPTAPKIFREDGEINWSMPAASIYNLIRGLSPYPAAWTVLDGKTFKIYETSIEKTTPIEPAGTFVTDNKSFIKVAAADGYLQLLQVQQEGKKKMGVKEFLNGYKLTQA
ncbi:MAG: methionyl-tRNA formyltransferase [Chitinophagales bacterium]|nr:methionyl-tRNA formyltransferase [Chitinophagales bacterium]